MDEKYEVLLTGDSSGQVKIYLGRDPSFFCTIPSVKKAWMFVCKDLYMKYTDSFTKPLQTCNTSAWDPTTGSCLHQWKGGASVPRRLVVTCLAIIRRTHLQCLSDWGRLPSIRAAQQTPPQCLAGVHHRVSLKGVSYKTQLLR